MRIARLVILVCVAVLASCDSTDPGAPSVVLARATGHDRVVEVDERVTVSVRAINRRSKPVAGVTVIWGGEPGGNIDQSSAVTAADGIASTEVRVRFGVNRILARIQGTPTVTDIVVHGCSRCGEWSRAPLDVAAMSHAWGSAAAIGDQIWVVGGATSPNPEHGVSVVDPTGATWRRTLDLPTRLIGPVAVAGDGYL